MDKTNEKSSPAGGRTIKSISLNSDSKGTIPKSSGNLLHILGKSKRLKTVLDCFYKYIPRPLVVYDSPGLGIVYANPAFLSLFGYTNKDVTALTIKDLFNSNGEEDLFQQRYKERQNAQNLVIELISEDETINVSISDDGKGFDADLVKPNRELDYPTLRVGQNCLME